MSPFVDELRVQATQLLGVRASEEVLAVTCPAVLRLAGAGAVFGSLGTSSAWATGVHRQFRASGQADVGPAQRSAMFAVHRAVSRQRGPATLTRASEATIVEALCGADAPAMVLAFPIVHRRGHLCGCLALCAGEPLSDDVTAAVVELASLAALALDNVQRISSARRDRERLSLLAEAAEEALWDWSPETGEFWWGGGVQTLIGDVVVQSRLSWKFEQVHPDDAGRVRRSFEQALADAGAETWHEEYRQRRTDGRWILVEDHAHILRDSSGRAHRVVGALRNVTELRTLLAREHAARAEAERASLAKDEFLAMLGHELRNPLSPIVSALHLLRLRAGPETIDKGLTIIERQARHLIRLVDDLLDVARIAQGKVLLERERIDLGDVIDAALETVNPLIEERRHAVEASVARNLIADADRERMQQVIGNLISNAAKYTPPGGRIVVEGRAADGLVQVRVADNGIGIAADMLPRIFDTFVQGRQELDRTRGGLGLGLAIVRNLVQLHGGTVEARSEGDGRGAEFVVRIPAAASTTGVAAAAAPATVAHDGERRILIVDDNVDAAESLADELSTAGYETRVVHDGPAALAAVVDLDPQVVLMDLGLPIMDGYEVARQLRRQHGAACPRLVAVTGYGQDRDRQKSREAGFDIHLVKPVLFERLREAIAGTVTAPRAADEHGGDALSTARAAASRSARPSAHRRRRRWDSAAPARCATIRSAAPAAPARTPTPGTRGSAAC